MKTVLRSPVFMYALAAAIVAVGALMIGGTRTRCTITTTTPDLDGADARIPQE